MHPVLLHFGHLTLPSFGALAALGLILALALSERTAPRAGIAPDGLWDAGLFAILAAFLFSRALLLIAHLQTFARFPLLLLAVPSLTPPGLLLTAAATIAWLRSKRIPRVRAFNAWAPCATLLWAFLSLGHFAEGSDPGLATGAPWGMRMPGDPLPLHPVALYACLLASALTPLVFRRVTPGDAAAVALIGSGLGQFLLSFVRQPGALLLGLDDLQWVALAMLATGLILRIAGWNQASRAQFLPC